MKLGEIYKTVSNLVHNDWCIVGSQVRIGFDTHDMASSKMKDVFKMLDEISEITLDQSLGQLGMASAKPERLKNNGKRVIYIKATGKHVGDFSCFEAWKMVEKLKSTNQGASNENDDA